jgi:hypothetical protein
MDDFSICPRGRILATQLPVAIAAKIRGRSRVSVRNVRDLQLYMGFVESLCNEYRAYEGSKSDKNLIVC